MVVPKFVGFALASRPTTVFDDGTQTRCLCRAGDVVQALVDPMLLGDAAYGEVFAVPYDEAYEDGFEDMPRRVPGITQIQAALAGPQPIARRDPGRRREPAAG